MMTLISGVRLLNPICHSCGLSVLLKRLYSIESKYTDVQKQKIIEALNGSDVEALSSYDITKARIKHLNQWKSTNGAVKSISDIEFVEGFSERTAKKLFDSILKGPEESKHKVSNKIKGQILQPNLSRTDIENCNLVSAVYVTVNSVIWTLIAKDSYELIDWRYHSINYTEGKKLQITDILQLAWDIINQIPSADIYVMKAEATTLRAAGNDPNNPKVLAVNLQKAQMIAMIIAMINARHQDMRMEDGECRKIKNKVYFLRPTLPYRLYGTLVGNERVSTEQTVEALLQNKELSPVHFPETLIQMFRSQNDLQKDMLGHCLLLSLTFMDLCIYKNQERIAKLLQNRE